MKALDLALFAGSIAAFAASYLRPDQAARRWLLVALVLGAGVWAVAVWVAVR